MPGRKPRPYDPLIAADLLHRIRDGELLRDLWRDPTLPGRYTLKRWREENPHFAAALRAAVNAARSAAYRARSPYDPEVVRRRLCAHARVGNTLRQTAADPHLPCAATILQRLREDPDLAWDVAVARDGYLDRLQAFATGALAGLKPSGAKAAVALRCALLDMRRLPKKYSVDLIVAERAHAHRQAAARRALARAAVRAHGLDPDQVLIRFR